jgi:hypothetical protein
VAQSISARLQMKGLGGSTDVLSPVVASPPEESLASYVRILVGLTDSLEPDSGT